MVKKLRNREICAPCSTNSTPSLNDTIPFEENEGIFEQSEPEIMTEEHHATLIDEIKQLQVRTTRTVSVKNVDVNNAITWVYFLKYFSRTRNQTTASLQIYKNYIMLFIPQLL